MVTDDVDAVLKVFLGFWMSRGVMEAVELGVFDLLDAGDKTLEEMGNALTLADRPVSALLDTCVAAGLLEREGNRYRNSPLATKYLCESSPYPLRNYVLDERWGWPAWGRLAEALRSNAPPLEQDADGYHTFPEEFLLDFLHGHSLVMGERLASAVDLTGAKRLMDLGGGSGAVSISLCRAFPALRAVVVDQEPVLVKARGHIEAAALADRIETHAANLFEDPLPAGCDAAVIASVLHDFSPERAQRILDRAFEALPPHGRLVVMEIAPDEDRAGPPLAVAFALTMIVNTAGGDAYTPSQYRGFIEVAGFTDMRMIPLGGELVTTAFEARKPA